MKQCTICNSEKEIDEFLRDKHSKGGYRNQCKACLRERNKGVWERRSEGYNRAMRKFRSTWKGATQTSLSAAKLRTRELNLPELNIDNEYLREILEAQNYKCALTGVDLIPKGGWLCPSLDKMDPTLGYVKGNVQWVTKRANLLKGNLTMEQLRELCKSILDNSEESH